MEGGTRDDYFAPACDIQRPNRPSKVLFQAKRIFPVLILTRKVGQAIDIGGGIEVSVLSTRSGHVKLGLAAPRNVVIRRGELGPLPVLDCPGKLGRSWSNVATNAVGKRSPPCECAVGQIVKSAENSPS